MSYNDWPLSISPFPPDYRASSLLLHVTSLPSAYGIGDLGPSGFEWIDRLQDEPTFGHDSSTNSLIRYYCKFKETSQ